MKRIMWDVGSVGAFILVVLVFFWQTFWGKLPVPADALVGLYHPWRDYYSGEYPRGVPYKNFLITDPVRQQIPWRKLAVDSWKRGVLPWWNPTVLSGAPLAGNIQAAVFYPLNILFFFFSFPVAWTLLIGVQPLIGGILLFVFLRHHKLHALAAFFGAVSWSFSGFAVSWMTWGTIVQSAIWLPLILTGIDALVEGRKSWWISVFVGMCMSLLAGHIQIALYVYILSFAYLMFRRRQTSGQMQKKEWEIFAVGTAVILVTAVQWAPFLRLLLESSRNAGASWQEAGFFLPWKHLVGFVVPDFFGNPATLNYWGVWNWAEFAGYIGVIPLMFAGVALFSRWKDTKFWFGTVVTALIFALPTVVGRLPYELGLPMLSSLQPTRLVVLIDFGLVVLASLGLDTFIRRPVLARFPLGVLGAVFITIWIFVLVSIRQLGGEALGHMLVAKRNLILPTAFFVAGIVGMYAGNTLRRMRLVSVLILVGLSVFDVLRFGWKFTPFTPREYFFPETSIISFLRKQTGPFRVMSLDDQVLPPNTASYFGIETIEGYDPIYSSRYEEYIAAASRKDGSIAKPYGFNRILVSKNIDSPLLAFLNVKYVLTRQDLHRAFLIKVYEEGETKVYENKRVLPRVMFAQRVIQQRDPQKIIQTLMENPSGNVAVTDSPQSIISMPIRLGEWANIISYTANFMEIRAVAVNPRFLVIYTSYDPGWKASIDNESVPVMRADGTFMGIIVPAGSHTIRLYYQPFPGILFHS